MLIYRGRGGGVVSHHNGVKEHHSTTVNFISIHFVYFLSIFWGSFVPALAISLLTTESLSAYIFLFP